MGNTASITAGTSIITTLSIVVNRSAETGSVSAESVQQHASVLSSALSVLSAGGNTTINTTTADTAMAVALSSLTTASQLSYSGQQGAAAAESVSKGFLECIDAVLTSLDTLAQTSLNDTSGATVTVVQTVMSVPAPTDILNSASPDSAELKAYIADYLASSTGISVDADSLSLGSYKVVDGQLVVSVGVTPDPSADGTTTEQLAAALQSSDYVLSASASVQSVDTNSDSSTDPTGTPSNTVEVVHAVMSVTAPAGVTNADGSVNSEAAKEFILQYLSDSNVAVTADNMQLSSYKLVNGNLVVGVELIPDSGNSVSVSELSQQVESCEAVVTASTVAKPLVSDSTATTGSGSVQTTDQNLEVAKKAMEAVDKAVNIVATSLEEGESKEIVVGGVSFSATAVNPVDLATEGGVFSLSSTDTIVDMPPLGALLMDDTTLASGARLETAAIAIKAMANVRREATVESLTETDASQPTAARTAVSDVVTSIDVSLGGSTVTVEGLQEPIIMTVPVTKRDPSTFLSAEALADADEFAGLMDSWIAYPAGVRRLASGRTSMAASKRTVRARSSFYDTKTKQWSSSGTGVALADSLRRLASRTATSGRTSLTSTRKSSVTLSSAQINNLKKTKGAGLQAQIAANHLTDFTLIFEEVIEILPQGGDFTTPPPDYETVTDSDSGSSTEQTSTQHAEASTGSSSETDSPTSDNGDDASVPQSELQGSEVESSDGVDASFAGYSLSVSSMNSVAYLLMASIVWLLLLLVWSALRCWTAAVQTQPHPEALLSSIITQKDLTVLRRLVAAVPRNVDQPLAAAVSVLNHAVATWQDPGGDDTSQKLKRRASLLFGMLETKLDEARQQPESNAAAGNQSLATHLMDAAMQAASFATQLLETGGMLSSEKPGKESSHRTKSKLAEKETIQPVHADVFFFDDDKPKAKGAKKSMGDGMSKGGHSGKLKGKFKGETVSVIDDFFFGDEPEPAGEPSEVDFPSKAAGKASDSFGKMKTTDSNASWPSQSQTESSHGSLKGPAAVIAHPSTSALTAHDMQSLVAFLDRTAYLRQSPYGMMASAFTAAQPFTRVRKFNHLRWALLAATNIAIHHLSAIAIVVITNGLLVLTTVVPDSTPSQLGAPLELPGATLEPGSLSVPILYSLHAWVALGAALVGRLLLKSAILSVQSVTGSTRKTQPPGIVPFVSRAALVGIAVAMTVWMSMAVSDDGFAVAPKRPALIRHTVAGLGNVLVSGMALILWDLIVGPLLTALSAVLVRRSVCRLPFWLVAHVFGLFPSMAAGSHSVGDDTQTVRAQTDLTLSVVSGKPLATTKAGVGVSDRLRAQGGEHSGVSQQLTKKLEKIVMHETSNARARNRG
eukprot:GDKI01011393.1.p1 GENE.GDKI01011393.1~~GDKI01011393.1.p1  ORF type:complete len:1368 (-),score=362.87 GDKI01011393.1:34-4107(-)